VTGVSPDGTLQCASTDPCAGILCLPHQQCQVLPGSGGTEVAQCVDGCDGFVCAQGSVCELQPVSCITAPCPPVAQCVPEQGADVCSLSLDPGPCRAAIPRWGHDPDSGRCERFVYSGCGGNGNNFTTLDACARACQGGGGSD
jgi:hypothetical protein